MATEAVSKQVMENGHDDDDDNPLLFKTSVMSSTVKDGDQSHRKSFDIQSDDGDSDDDTPLTSIVSRNSFAPKKAPAFSLDRSSKLVKDESDDEAPLSSRFQKKHGNGISGSKHEKNGSTLENEGPKVTGKRLLEKGNSADQSSMKKPKVSSSSTSVAMKQDSVKTEKQGDKRKVVVVSPKQLYVKEDETDDVPIAKRIKSDSSNNKTISPKSKVVKQSSTSSATKAKGTRVVSPRSKTSHKKSKKVTKDSKYAKTSKSFPSGDGKKKWTTLVHNGVTFPPSYKPHGIKILYKGKPVSLSPEQEEVATMFAVMRETEFYNKPKFRENFWNDWRKLLGKNHVIQKLDDCDFTPIYEWNLEEKKEKKASREKKLKQGEKYMCAIVDGVKEKVGNFRIEPPALFKGRGEHPKLGKLKRRIHPCDITLNIGEGAPIPECPIPGERWKEVKHDNTVTWLAIWNDPINKRYKYVSLSPSSSQKGQSDKDKYEKARKLKDHIDSIRATYTKNFTAKDVSKRQIAVATYLIDKLALRAGNMELMPGLTAKVFRTYNASITLDVMLRQETRDGDVNQKVVVYQQANKEVAIICNHQRTVSKSHGAQIGRLAGKIEEVREDLKELKTNLERAKKGKAPLEGSDGKKTRNITPEAWEKKIAQQMMKTEKMERNMKTKEDLKTVALGTSKINYMDPRITVSWCKRHEVPIEKIFNKSLLEKFTWAMDVEPEFRF